MAPENERLDEGWKAGSWVETYLDGIRDGIPMGMEQIDVLLRLIEAACPDPRRILDLGSGDGVLAAAVLSRYAGASATLVDFSPPMVDRALERFAGAAFDVNLLVEDFSTPGWTAAVREEAPFDVVVSGYAIHHQTDARKRELYGEILALLKPGGIFLNMEHVASPSPWVRSVAETHFSDSLTAYQLAEGTRAGFPAEKLAERKDREANVLASVETQCRWLMELGYEEVDCFFKVFELAVFGGRRSVEGKGG
jgi:SAM-dependent methyltransferase